MGCGVVEAGVRGMVGILGAILPGSIHVAGPPGSDEPLPDELCRRSIYRETGFIA